MLEPDIQILVCHIQAECGRHDTNLRLPEIDILPFWEFVHLNAKRTKMFFQTFDGSTEGNTLIMVMQMCTSRRRLVRSIVVHHDFAQVETCTFRRHHGVTTNHIVSEGENLVHLGLGIAIHVKHTCRSREQLGQNLLQDADYFGKRTVPEDFLAEIIPV